MRVVLDMLLALSTGGLGNNRCAWATMDLH